MNRAMRALLVALTAFTCGCDDAPPPTPEGGSPFALPSNPLSGDAATRVQDGAVAAAPTTLERASAPAAPTPVAGIRGLRVDGRIELAESTAGAPVLTLRTLRRWVFPERGRSDISQPELGPAHRTRHQRFGGRLWFLDAGELEPVELTAPERTAAQTRAALEHVALDVAYRAALLWPDGFEWTDTSDGTRSARLDDSIAGALELRATPPTVDDRLTIDVLQTNELLVHLVAMGRYEHPTRRFPASVAVTTVHDRFTETFERIDPRAFYLDTLFAVAPPRATEAEAGPPTTLLRIERVPERPWRRQPFDAPHSDFALARERAAQLLSDLNPTHADGADVVFELDDEARFAALVVRLAPGSDVPDGFEAARPGSALGVEVDPAPTGARVRALETLAAATASTNAGPPYIIQLGDTWQVVLPVPGD